MQAAHDDLQHVHASAQAKRGRGGGGGGGGGEDQRVGWDGVLVMHKGHVRASLRYSGPVHPLRNHMNPNRLCPCPNGLV